jgi:hypothetical protein
MESIWLKNPSNLFKYYDNFSITNSGNKFNALTRCLIISGIICVLFNRYNWSYICFIAILFTSFVGYKYDDYESQLDRNNKERIFNSCRRSTIDNPMMNLLAFDQNPELDACDEDTDIIDKNLYHEFYEDQNNINARKKLRNFITLPVTNIKGKREEFLQFTYGNDINCKYDGIGCEKYRDVRFIL